MFRVQLRGWRKVIGHLLLISSTALLSLVPNTTCAPKLTPFPRRENRGLRRALRTAPPRSQRCPSPHQDCLRAPPRARLPATPAPGPPLLTQAHTTYKRKDSTSQSSAASMATVASHSPLPFRNLPGAGAALSREVGAACSDPKGVALSQGAGPRVASRPLPMQCALALLGSGFSELLPEFRDSKDVSSGRGLKDQVSPRFTT